MADAVYIDTSCLLKLLFPEPESAAVAQRIAGEATVVVSSLTRVEAEQQIASRRAGGKLTAARERKVRGALADLLTMAPFQSERLSGVVWDVALAQVLRVKEPCRTLDRLHLAAMEGLGLKRLLTHDVRQAAAAAELGIELVAF